MYMKCYFSKLCNSTRIVGYAEKLRRSVESVELKGKSQFHLFESLVPQKIKKKLQGILTRYMSFNAINSF